MIALNDFFADYIARWEGGLSLDPDDAGNWYLKKLIGSNRGVTGAALAAYRSTATITADDIAKLTLDEAAAIGRKLYYDQPGFAKLAWNRVTASVVDFGWGAGPKVAAKQLQRMLGLTEDGYIGPVTTKAFADYVNSHGEEFVAGHWSSLRNAYYDATIAAHPEDAKYRRGWRARTDDYTPASAWWRRAAS